jgi:preprotein translocase subunit SecD
MNTIRNLLQNADPVRYEPERPAAERDRLRQTVIRATSPDSAGSARPARSRITLLATLALIVAGASMGWRIWPHGGATLQAAVRLEVRLAENSPAAGLQETRVSGSGNVVYLHPEVIVSNGDIARTRVVPGNGPARFGVAVVFTEAGSERMRQATASHIGKPLAIIIDGEIAAIPILRSPISDSALISGDFTKTEAERIANGMTIR